MLAEKTAQRESCKLNCIGGKMKTITPDTTSQKALRNCSEDVAWMVSIIYDFSETGGSCNQAQFWQRLAASHKEQMSPLMILVFSRHEKIQELGLIKSSENM